MSDTLPDTAIPGTAASPDTAKSAPAGPSLTMIGPGNIDGRWHFAPVEVTIRTDSDGLVVFTSSETPAVGRGPTKAAAFRDWMLAVVRRYRQLATQMTASAAVPPPATTPPPQTGEANPAREWKWMSRVVRPS